LAKARKVGADQDSVVDGLDIRGDQRAIQVAVSITSP
jgi:hypothetical protein